MRSVIVSWLFTLRASLRDRTALQLEILALRHQLHVLNRSRPRRLRLTQVGGLHHRYDRRDSLISLPRHCHAVGLGRVGVRLNLHDRAYSSGLQRRSPRRATLVPLSCRRRRKFRPSTEQVWTNRVSVGTVEHGGGVYINNPISGLQGRWPSNETPVMRWACEAKWTLHDRSDLPESQVVSAIGSGIAADTWHPLSFPSLGPVAASSRSVVPSRPPNGRHHALRAADDSRQQTETA